MDSLWRHACASIPPKQKATQANQPSAIETALNLQGTRPLGELNDGVHFFLSVLWSQLPLMATYWPRARFAVDDFLSVGLSDKAIFDLSKRARHESELKGTLHPLLSLSPPFMHTASLAYWLRCPPRERKIPGSNPACAEIFSVVESYQWLKNWHSTGYPARRLALKSQCWDW